MSAMAPQLREATTERWTIDPRRTTVEFEVQHLWGLHTVRGHFDRFDGSYAVGIAGAKIELVVDAGSIDTGNAMRDAHLRSDDFFDLEAHPVVRFTSTRIVGTGTGEVRVSGAMVAAGKTVPVVFDAPVRLIDGELEIDATVTVDQSRFGMSAGPLRNIRRGATLHVKARLLRRAAHAELRGLK